MADSVDGLQIRGLSAFALVARVRLSKLSSRTSDIFKGFSQEHFDTSEAGIGSLESRNGIGGTFLRRLISTRCYDRAGQSTA
jgi:hypothetical protein